jgi:hypothetical protein
MGSAERYTCFRGDIAQVFDARSAGQRRHHYLHSMFNAFQHAIETFGDD